MDTQQLLHFAPYIGGLVVLVTIAIVMTGRSSKTRPPSMYDAKPTRNLRPEDPEQ